MASADDYAKWIVNNADKKGTPDFDIVAKAYEDAKAHTSIPTPIQQPEPAGIMRRAGDIGISALQGVVSLPEVATGLADIPTMGYAGKGVEEAEKAIFGGTTKDVREKLQEYKSAEQKAAEQKVAEAEGFGGTLKEYLKNPSAIADVVAQSAPSMIGGAGIARGLLASGAKLGEKKLATSVAAAIGEGMVTSGQIAEQIRQDSKEGLLTPGQAGLATLAGVFTGGLSRFGSKVANRLGTENLETILAGGELNLKAAQHPMLAAVKGALNESVFEELPQSIQEQILQNIAEDKPWDEGVAQQVAAGMLAGIAMGGPASLFHQMKTNTAIAEEKRKQAEGTKKEEIKTEEKPATEEVKTKEKATTEAAINLGINDILNAKKVDLTEEGTKDESDITDKTIDEQGSGASTAVSGESVDGATTLPIKSVGSRLAGDTSVAGINQEGTGTKPDTLAEAKTTPVVETKEPTVVETKEPTVGLKLAENPEEQISQLKQLEKVKGRNKNVEVQKEEKEVEPVSKLLTREELESQLQAQSNNTVSLSQESYDSLHPYQKTISAYGNNSAPVTKEQAIKNAASETVLSENDLRDQEGYDKELQYIKESKEAGILAERQQRIDDLVAQGKTLKQAQNEVGGEKAHKLSTDRPLEFMTENELHNLEQKYNGKKEATPELAEENARREEFIKSLNPEEKATYDARLAQVRTEDRQAVRRRVQSKIKEKSKTREGISKLEKLLEKPAALSPKDVKTKLTETEDSIRDKQRRVVNKKVKDILAAEGKGTLRDVLKQLAGTDEFRRSFGYQTLAAKLLDKINSLVNNKAATTKISEATVQYGEVPNGRPAMFDPATSTITISTDPEATKGMHLGQIIAHEAMHYMLDHIIDNQKVPNFLSQNQKDALAKLERIRKQVAKVLGKEFDIPNLKEFIAEAFSNSEFQHALADLRAKPGTAFAAFKRTVHEMARAIMSAIGLGGMRPVILQDTLALIEDILTDTQYRLPGDNQGKSISFAPKAEPKQAEPKPEFNISEQIEKLTVKEYHKDTVWDVLKNTLWGSKAWKNIEKNFQNERQPIKANQQSIERAGLLQVLGDKFNNIYDYIATSFGQADFRFREYLEHPMRETRTLINDYAKAAGLKVSEALGNLHLLAQALHENERRIVKYLMHVPLSVDRILNINGTNYSPADVRKIIFDKVNSKDLLDINELKQLRAYLEDLVDKYKDAAGESMGDNKYTSTDVTSSEYNVAANMDVEDVKKIKEYYAPENYKYRAEMDAVLASLKPIQEATITLNGMGDYGTNALVNSKNFYDFKHYVPLKGRPESKLPRDSMKLDLDDVRLSTELKEGKHSFEGRKSDSENPIIQTMVDAAKASARAGRKGLTQAIKNTVEQKLIKGEIKSFTAQEVYDMSKKKTSDKFLERPNLVFHYNTDGSLDAINIDDRHLLEAIRRTYTEGNPILDKINSFTSAIGQSHTRYSPPFPILNYVRDALTNSFVMAIEKSPVEAFKYLGRISTQIATGGLYTANKVARLFHSGKIGELREYAKKNKYASNLLEYLEGGGRVSYIQGLSVKSQLDQLWRDVGKHKILSTKEDIEKFFDTYTDTFELAARAAAYGVVKDELIRKGMDEKAAIQQAIVYTKGLANFEEVGRYGKALGAMFIFFRPNATGAQRAITAIAPMLRSWNSVKRELDPQIFGKEGERTPEQQKAVDNYEAKWRKQSRAATTVCVALTAAGYVTYAMAAALGGHDDDDRNNVENDDLARWTRFARFDIGDGKVLNIPWGFGLGAFAASGAQIAGASMSPSNNMGDALTNIMTIGLDSFLPLPVSRISPKENFLGFMVDSISPSIARPFYEFTMNLNGFGQEIYNSRQTKYGDAYTGGDNVPDMYKDAAALLVEITDGGIDVSPNSLYFFTNSYMDGYGRMLSNTYDAGLIAQNKKEADITQNAFIFQSFFSRLSNVDQREFAKVEKEIQDKEKIINEFKASNPEQYYKYIENHPYDETMVNSFNKLVGGTLKNLRVQANRVRRDRDLTPQEKKEQLDDNKISQNMIKKLIIENKQMFDELDSN